MKKRLTALMLAMALALSALSGCGSSAPEGEAPEEEAPSEYTTIYSTEVTSLNYLKSNTSEDIKNNYLVHDGLVEFDNYGMLIPSLAEKWDVSEDGLVYTFHLRDGLKWYDWEGNEVAPIVADDFMAGIEWSLNKDNASKNAKTIYESLANAKAYYDQEITDFSKVGVKALDDKTVEFTLLNPIPYFIKQVSFPAFFPVNRAFLNEQGEQFGVDKANVLYSGAYLIKTWEPQSKRVLEANPNYWHKDIISIPRLNYIYNKEANSIGAELFLRGEVNDFILPGSIVDDWMSTPEKKALIHPHNLTNMTYFIGFNFDPQFDAEFEPENWKKAVNNESFRKSILHAVDRSAAVLTLEPYKPETKLLNTFTRKGLVIHNGVDFTMMKGLKAYSEGDPFQPEKALEYKKKAMEELKDEVTFPVKILWPFSTAKVDTANRVQIIEQQVEKLLGEDYIDIILESHPGTGFSKQVRRPGMYAMMEMGWGPDFADPFGTLDPVLSDSLDDGYMTIMMCQDLLNPDGTSKFEEAVKVAAAETLDLTKRYEMFADAEQMLLDHAILLPFYTSGGGYIATYVDPFSGYTSQHGRYGLGKVKGAKLLPKPMGMDEYDVQFKAFEEERVKRLKAAAEN